MKVTRRIVLLFSLLTLFTDAQRANSQPCTSSVTDVILPNAGYCLNLCADELTYIEVLTLNPTGPVLTFLPGCSPGQTECDSQCTPLIPPDSLILGADTLNPDAFYGETSDVAMSLTYWIAGSWRLEILASVNGCCCCTCDPLPVPSQISASDDLCDEVQIQFISTGEHVDSFHVRRDGDIIGAVECNGDTTYWYSYTDSNPADSGSLYSVSSWSSLVGEGDTSSSDSGQAVITAQTVTGVQASDGLCDVVMVSWEGTISADEYFVFRDSLLINVVSAESLVFSDSTSLPGATYLYSVSAHNECGGSETVWTDTGFRSAPPDWVNGIRASMNRSDGVVISWDHSSELIGIRIYRDQVEIITLPPDCTSWFDASPGIGLHEYQIIPMNECGSGGTQTPAIGAVMPDTVVAVDSLVVHHLSDSTIRLDWFARHPGKYEVWSSDFANNDGNPDNGQDPQWELRYIIVTGPQFHTLWIDTSTIVAYRSYVVSGHSTFVVSEKVIKTDTTRWIVQEITDSTIQFAEIGGTMPVDTGTILIDDNVFGYFRRVTSFSRQDSQLFVQTVNANLSELLPHGALDTILTSSRTTLFVDLTGTEIVHGVYNGINVSAEITQGSASYDFVPRVAIQNVGGFPIAFELYLEGTYFVDCEFLFSASGELPLMTESLNLITLDIPVLLWLEPPIWVTFRTNFEAEVVLGSSFPSDTRFHVESQGPLKVGMRKGIVGPPQPLFEESIYTQFEERQAPISVETEATLSVKVVSGAYLYSVLGPSIEAGASLFFRYRNTPDSLAWRLGSDVRSDFVADLAPFGWNIFDVDFNLAHGEIIWSGLKIHPRMLNFGPVTIGQSASLNFALANLGVWPQIGTLTFLGEPFAVEPSSHPPIVISTNTTRQYSVEFTPNEVGHATGQANANMGTVFPYTWSVHLNGDGNDSVSNCEECRVTINEVLYDTQGPDDPNLLFTELFGPPGTSLDGWWLVGINGNGCVSYGSIQLNDSIPSDGFYVIGNTNLVPNVDFVLNLGAGLGVDWQNAGGVSDDRCDCVRLFNADSLLVDRICYGICTESPPPPEDAECLGEGNQNAPDLFPYLGWNFSLARIPDGADTDNNFSDFIATCCVTPGFSNYISSPEDTCHCDNR